MSSYKPSWIVSNWPWDCRLFMQMCNNTQMDSQIQQLVKRVFSTNCSEKQVSFHWPHFILIYIHYNVSSTSMAVCRALWHSAYHVNTCLERRSAPLHQSWSDMITSCQAFHNFCPFELLLPSASFKVVCIIQSLIEYIVFSVFIQCSSCVLSGFPARSTFCAINEHSWS